MKTEITRGSAKEKILQVASELFYRQGYNATGIQQIIDLAEVSKGTFYTHFKTKDDLGLAYLQKRHHDEISELKSSLSQFKTPYEKYVNFGVIMKEWMMSTGYRGCAFANMAAEITDCKCLIRKEAKFHYESFRMVIRDFIEDLIRSDNKYAHLNANNISDDYMLVMIGAITNSEIYQDTWPFDRACCTVKELIGEKG